MKKNILQMLRGDSTPLTPVEKHQVNSDNAFNVFKETVNSLSTTNSNIDDDIAIENQKIEDAKANKRVLTGIKVKNAKLVTKINEFFELD